MHQLSEYSIYIFDCDGVILDSNELKIQAMRKALEQCHCKEDEIKGCLDYFKNNFGKSRFHHIKLFVDEFIERDEVEVINLYNDLLEYYSNSCKKLYLTAEITPAFLSFIGKLKGDKYIASGSAQEELRDVFYLRGLSKYFNGIFGSPVKKTEIVNNIIIQHDNAKIVMFGDAISDFEASTANGIDFIGYIPYSNVADKIKEYSKKYNFPVIEEWNEII